MKQVLVWVLAAVLMLPALFVIVTFGGFYLITYVNAKRTADEMGGAFSIGLGFNVPGGYWFFVLLGTLFVVGMILLVRYGTSERT